MSALSAAQARTLDVSSSAIPLVMGRPTLEPVCLSGSEGLNSLFAYELLLKTPDALNFGAGDAMDLDLDSFIGREITCNIQLDGAGQFVAGAVGVSTDHVGAGIRQISALITDAAMWGEEGRHVQYKLTLRPWLHLATLATDCKIYQNQTVDGLETLRKVVTGKPCVSFVRSSTALPALCATLAWLAAAETSDGMPLYLRIGDTRVLGSFLPHVRPAQEARLHATLHAWAWPGRNGRLQRVETEAMPAAQPAAPILVLDDAQYAALLDEAEADMLHAGMQSVEAGWIDERSGSELHRWLKAMSQKMRALGIHRQKDQWAFVSLALRAPDGFETLPELGESWLRVRSGTAALHDEISRWDSAQWQALRRLANEKAAASAAPSKGFR